jgi:hypothetical protein
MAGVVREVNVGGRLVGGPAAITQWCLGNDGFQVYVRGTDNALWEKSVPYAGTFGPGWDGPAGVLGAEPAVAVNPEHEPPVGEPPDTEVQVLVRGSDGHLWHRTRELFCVLNCFRSPWKNLGGALLDRPGATVNPNSYRAVFVRGVDNALWGKFGLTYGAWGGWVPLGGILTAGPAGGFEQLSDASYRFFAVVRGSDGHAWRIVNLAPGIWRWQDLGGLLASAPSVTVRQSSAGPFPEIYVVGTDGWVYVNSAAPVGGAFQGWRRVFLPS